MQHRWTIFTIGLLSLAVGCASVESSTPDSSITFSDVVVPVSLSSKGGTLVHVKDANLNAQTRHALALLAEGAAEGAKVPTSTPIERRRINDSIYIPLGLTDGGEADVEERYINSRDSYLIRVRIYTPKSSTLRPLPVIAYYHGGGMMVGSLEQYEPIMKRLSAGADAIVVNVDYRMSPEYKFPAATNDSYDALKWIYENAATIGGDPSKMAVAGDSAGGQLAAVMTQLARDRNGPQLIAQALIYPAVGTNGDSTTLDTYSEGYVFGRAELEWAYGSWVSAADQMNDPLVSPILVNSFASLPPAFVASAEFEIMRDDIELYASKLSEAGVPVQLKRFDGTVHPFMNMAGIIDQGREVIDDMALFLRNELYSKTPASAAD